MYGDLMAPGTIKHSGLYAKCPIFLPDFNKI
jgi:hypothetical protein